MGLRQERVDLVSLPIECERVCAYFRGHHLLAAHCFNVNDVYYSWVSDRHIKLVGWRVQKYYVRCPAYTNIAKHITRVRVNCEEYAGIAGAQQAARNGIEIQSMRPRRRNVVLPRYFGGITSINNNDARWGSDVDEKQLARFVVNCPARTTGHLDFRNALSACEVYNRHRVRIRDQWIANVCREQDAASGVECEPVWFHAYRNLETLASGAW